MIAERAQGALVSMKVTSDEEIIVDRMIAASQRKGEVALPSFGRDLVPYFVPGTESWNENDVNVNTDLDSFRRQGASLLDIPVPTFRELGSKSVQQTWKPSLIRRERKSKRKSKKQIDDHAVVGTQASLKSIKVNSSDPISIGTSPTSPLRFSTSQSSSSESDVPEPKIRHEVPKTVAPRPSFEMLSSSAPSGGFMASLINEGINSISERRLTSSNVSSTPGSPENRLCSGATLALQRLNEKWAGPAFANSPPPSCVPIPTFACKNKETALEANPGMKPSIGSPVQSAPTSPAPSAVTLPSSMLSADTYFIKRDQLSGLGSRRRLDMDAVTSIEGPLVKEATNNLKKILQIF